MASFTPRLKLAYVTSDGQTNKGVWLENPSQHDTFSIPGHFITPISVFLSMGREKQNVTNC